MSEKGNVRKVALFVNTGHDSNIESARPVEEWADTHDGYTRVSEFVEVEFPLRKADEYVPEQIDQLEKKKAELRLELEEKLKHIDTLIGTLAALEHKPV